MQDFRNLRIKLVFGLCAALVYAGQPACAMDIAHGAATSLQRELARLADEARPGTLGLAISDLESGRTWHINAKQAFPMISVFKAPLGATVLSEVDAGTLYPHPEGYREARRPRKVGRQPDYRNFSW